MSFFRFGKGKKKKEPGAGKAMDSAAAMGSSANMSSGTAMNLDASTGSGTVMGSGAATESGSTIGLDADAKGRMPYRAANLQGAGARKRQEDSFAVTNVLDAAKISAEGLFFAVCDGMGGMRDGHLASETAVQSLRQSFLMMDRGQDIAAQLKQSIFRASEQVEALIGGDGGSTVVVGILYQDMLYYASVGDSYFYLLRDGILLRLNAEQNLLHQTYLEYIRDGDMDCLLFPEVQGSAALTGFLGMTGLDEIDCSVRPLPVNKGDVLLACSDGIGSVLGRDEVQEALQRESVEEMCSELDRMIVSHQKTNQDNYTAIVIKCNL